MTRRARTLGRAVLASGVFAALFAVGCQEPEPMPLEPAATWLIESMPNAAGNPFELVLFVRTPQGHRAHAYDMPELEGIDVVERRILPPHTEGDTLIHREVLLARARGTGRHRWPASVVQVTDPDGASYALELGGVDLEVPSVLGEGAPPRRPRGYRAAPAAPTARGFGAGFAAGTITVGVLALLWIRRTRNRNDVAPAGAPVGTPGGRTHIGGAGRLFRRLEAARAAVREDPERAAADAASALRHFAADRFLVATHAESPEELRRSRPAHAEAAVWGAFTDRLLDVESARFGAIDPSTRTRALERAIDAALAFAADQGGDRSERAHR